ncbi:AsmA-like C-terminal region-containing protein [Breoghania sp.]|uniref:AsmA-like C-terminal region-containing protein n=1 Tax=Breoghania sp. TaxID=2065378 RepID=UPI002AAB116B|nr:AsmA-like C-terminal region-containing protein [Breoghania sp.]
MKRWLILASLAVLLVAAFFAALPLLVSTEIAKDRIAAVLSDWLGADVEVEGRPHVTFTSGLSVVLPDVRAANRDQKMRAHFEAVEAEVKWLPLLTGDIELSRFLLRKPQIIAEAASSAFAVSTLRRDPTQWPFATNELRIEDGSFLILHDGLPDGRENERVTGINGTLTWPGARGEAVLSAAFIWHGEAMEVRAGLSDTAVFAGAAQKASLNLKLTSTPLRMNFEGVLLGPTNLQANGKASLTMPNLRRALAWVGRDPGEGATLGPFSAEFQARANASGLVMDQATLELDGNIGTGLIALGWRDQRPSVQATLDFEKLDLSGYISEWLRAEPLPKGGNVAMPVETMAAADIDVQLSARQVRIGAARIGRTATSFLLKNGNIAFDISEAVLYGGTLTARLSSHMDRTDGTAPKDGSPLSAKAMAVTGDVRVQNIDLGALPLEDTRMRPTSGVARGSLNLMASGLDLDALASSAKGHFDLTVDGLTLSQVDIARAIETFTMKADEASGAPTDAGEKGDPLPAPTADTQRAAAETGRTSLDTLELAATVENGTASFTKVSAASKELAINAQGRASLPERTIALTGQATRKGDPAATVLFLVRGPLLNPQFLPDVNRMIEQRKATEAKTHGSEEIQAATGGASGASTVQQPPVQQAPRQKAPALPATPPAAQ